jgi:hypothetical protein
MTQGGRGAEIGIGAATGTALSAGVGKWGQQGVRNFRVAPMHRQSDPLALRRNRDLRVLLGKEQRMNPRIEKLELRFVGGEKILERSDHHQSL